ncbi:DUF192 domain-containing protein [Streptomyces barringtoniae]|uniref:DUF192 domain-containing protein n=1 Tax=Streptomyces barringtoniae TaxID=2892029 RepID=UPI001E570F34|nr:DUF192 domain-containing protein [Streptomyces barringtoniae]MCC5480676.1 DUF192 domain-containing protein [Streptomyces barringtoniae]
MGRRWRDGSGRLIVPRDGDGEAPRDEDGEKPTAAPLTLPLEIAASYRARTKGLLGRDSVAGAMLLTPASGVHTFGMRIPIDVAYLDRHLTVLAVRTMPPGRLGLPRLRARHVLEAEAGAMAWWGVRVGVRVTVEAG